MLVTDPTNCFVIVFANLFPLLFLLAFLPPGMFLLLFFFLSLYLNSATSSVGSMAPTLGSDSSSTLFPSMILALESDTRLVRADNIVLVDSVHLRFLVMVFIPPNMSITRFHEQIVECRVKRWSPLVQRGPHFL